MTLDEAWDQLAAYQQGRYASDGVYAALGSDWSSAGLTAPSGHTSFVVPYISPQGAGYELVARRNSDGLVRHLGYGPQAAARTSDYREEVAP
jgi:hypothetical protein